MSDEIFLKSKKINKAVSLRDIDQVAKLASVIILKPRSCGSRLDAFTEGYKFRKSLDNTEQVYVVAAKPGHILFVGTEKEILDKIEKLPVTKEAVTNTLYRAVMARVRKIIEFDPDLVKHKISIGYRSKATRLWINTNLGYTYVIPNNDGQSYKVRSIWNNIAYSVKTMVAYPTEQSTDIHLADPDCVDKLASTIICHHKEREAQITTIIGVQ